jgi:hypothetical protein
VNREAIRFLKNKNLQSGADARKGVSRNLIPAMTDNADSPRQSFTCVPLELVKSAGATHAV